MNVIDIRVKLSGHRSIASKLRYRAHDLNRDAERIEEAFPFKAHLAVRLRRLAVMTRNIAAQLEQEGYGK